VCREKIISGGDGKEKQEREKGEREERRTGAGDAVK
jgi:hypothetical protein